MSLIHPSNKEEFSDWGRSWDHVPPISTHQLMMTFHEACLLKDWSEVKRIQAQAVRTLPDDLLLWGRSSAQSVKIDPSGQVWSSFLEVLPLCRDHDLLREDLSISGVAHFFRSLNLPPDPLKLVKAIYVSHPQVMKLNLPRLITPFVRFLSTHLAEFAPTPSTPPILNTLIHDVALTLTPKDALNMLGLLTRDHKDARESPTKQNLKLAFEHEQLVWTLFKDQSPSFWQALLEVHPHPPIPNREADLYVLWEKRALEKALGMSHDTPPEPSSLKRKI